MVCTERRLKLIENHVKMTTSISVAMVAWGAVVEQEAERAMQEWPLWRAL